MMVMIMMIEVDDGESDYGDGDGDNNGMMMIKMMDKTIERLYHYIVYMCVCVPGGCFFKY